MNTYRAISAEPVHAQANAESSTGIIEDTSAIRRSSLFDSATVKQIENAVKSAKDDRTASEAIRAIICEAEKPKVKASLRFHLIFNKGPRGTPINVVAEKNKLLVSEIPFYLKAYWLHEASRPELLDMQTNPDFEAYHREVVETNGERRTTNAVTFGIPFLPGPSKQDVEQFFENAHATSTLRKFADKGPIEWHPSRHLLSVQVGPQDFIISNKVTSIFSGVVGHGTSLGEQYINTDVSFEPATTVQRFSQQDGLQFRTYASYSVLPNSWKLGDGSTAHPLVIAHLSDVAQLRRLFTFRIPRADLKRLFGATYSDELQNFGYDYDSGKFSAAKAVEHQDFIWKNVLESQTEVLATARDDGSILLELRPSLDAFCSWAVPIASLRSE